MLATHSCSFLFGFYSMLILGNRVQTLVNKKTIKISKQPPNISAKRSIFILLKQLPQIFEKEKQS